MQFDRVNLIQKLGDKMHVVTRIWKQQPGKYFFISTKDRAGVWRDHPFTRRQFNQVVPFVEANLDKDLYWCPHGFDKNRRLRKHAEPPELLYSDMDEIDPRNIDYMPTIAWESSPGRFVGLWILDGIMSEELNRAMTYKIGADKGGWDLTQVLRIPGTKNYKYSSTPKVRMLWVDGPTWTVEELTKKLLSNKRTDTKTKNKARDIYHKFHVRLPHHFRREIFKGKPKEGKRSEVLWRLVNEAIEAGMSKDQAFEVLRVSPWNKFKRRRDGDEQLQREIGKGIDKDFDPEVEIPGDDPDDYSTEDDEPEVNRLVNSMAEQELQKVEWIWYPYLAKGEVTILEGDPGLGKSYLAQMVCKGIVDGDRLPSSRRRRVQNGRVVYFDIENSAGTVTKRRLVDNDCINLDRYFQDEEPFSIDDEETLDHVYEAVDKIRPTIIVFDTINTYIGRADTHKAAEVTQSFGEFRLMARRFDCAVLVLRHLTKGGRDRAIYRGQGNIAFAALARFVYLITKSPDDEDTRVLSCSKVNFAREPKSLTFRIDPLADTLKDQDRSRFTWGEFVDWTSDDLVAPRDNSAKGAKVSEAEAFLKELLADKPMDALAIIRAAEARGISKRTVQRARERLDVKIIKKGFGKKKKSMWSFADND